MLIDDIADVLSSGGAGTVGTTIFKGLMPDRPDACVAVYETGGLAPVHAMNPLVGQAVAERPRVQVVARAAQQDYETARSKASCCFKLLDGLPGRTVNATRYLGAFAVQSPFLLGRDESGRVLLGCNFDVVQELTA